MNRTRNGQVADSLAPRRGYGRLRGIRAWVHWKRDILELPLHVVARRPLGTRGYKRLDENEGRNVPLVWDNLDSVPVLFANQFIIQHYQDEFILTVGQMVLPPILGDEQAREAQLQEIERVSVKPLARIAFTRARLVELVAALEGQKEKYDRIQQARDEEMGGGI